MGALKPEYYQNENYSLRVVSKNPAMFPEQGAAGKSHQKGSIDYYAGGSPMPGRTFKSLDYRFGHNTQEKTDEIAGGGNHYTAEYWEYDSRTIRRWNVDPIIKSWESPYAAFSNNPIWFTDPLGLDTSATGDKTETTKPDENKTVVNKSEDKKDVKDLTASQKAVDFIKDYEKYEEKLYDDATGNATIGYGHLVHTGKVGTNKDKEKDFEKGITKEKAEELLKSDIKEKAEKFIKDNVTVKLTQNQFDALVAFTFNVGGGSFKSSTLLKKVNANDTDDAIRTQFKAWNKGTVDGKKVELEGLTKRRNQEADIYIKNEYDSTH